MPPRSALIAALGSVVAVIACGSEQTTTINQGAQSDSVQFVKADDPAMLRAFAKARETLDAFLARLVAKDPKISMPALKVKIQDGDEVEYFWVTPLKVTGAVYSGTIDNDPELVRNVHYGEVISFKKSEIYDWTYHDAKSGKTMGNFTACALLTHESPASAAEFKETHHLDCDP